MKTKKAEKTMKAAKAQKPGLTDTIESRTEIAPHTLKDRLKILFGHRQTVLTRIDVNVVIPKDGPTKFNYDFVGTQVYVWKQKTQKRIQIDQQAP